MGQSGENYQSFSSKHNLTIVFKFAIIKSMIITLDTNVLFAALSSNLGASHQILKLIVDEKIEMALSAQIYFEYYDVLTQKENLTNLNLGIKEVEDILDLIALIAKKHKIYFLLRPNLIDEKDNMFVECAFASNSHFLITSNIKDFSQSELKGFSFEVKAPGEFLRLWRDKNE